MRECVGRGSPVSGRKGGGIDLSRWGAGKGKKKGGRLLNPARGNAARPINCVLERCSPNRERKGVCNVSAEGAFFWQEAGEKTKHHLRKGRVEFSPAFTRKKGKSPAPARGGGKVKKKGWVPLLPSAGEPVFFGGCFFPFCFRRKKDPFSLPPCQENEKPPTLPFPRKRGGKGTSLEMRSGSLPPPRLPRPQSSAT